MPSLYYEIFKRMKLKGILVIILLAVSVTGFSQRWKLKRYEVSFGAGSTNVYGDIGGTADVNNLFGLKDIRINETRYSLYAGARYKIKKDLAVKLNLFYGKGVSNDANSRNENRNFSFKTTLIEPSFQFEYAFLSEDRTMTSAKLYNRRGMVNNFTVFSAYGFAGIGGVFFSPELNLGRSLLAGESASGYGNFGVVLPIGLGIKYALNKDWSLGIEFGRRIAFTDYLDGLTTNWSDHNDTYYFGVIQAIYKLDTNRKGIPEFLSRKRALRR